MIPKFPSWVSRLWSPVPITGWVPAIGGGFTEPDDAYRERLKREFGRTL